MLSSLYIISAPSGAGKTSLINKLIEKDPSIKSSVSCTTRDSRPGEEEGVNYHFISPESFKEKINQNGFLEHAQVFDNFYGTSKDSVEAQLATGSDVILEIDWQGAQQVRKLIPEAVSIFILPPSLAELEKRLTHRDTDSSEVIQRRMRSARDEMIHYNEFDYIIINNNFNIALDELHSIFLSGRLKKSLQIGKHANLIKSLISS